MIDPGLEPHEKWGRNGPGWVYVIGEPGDDIVKVGTAKELDKRLSELRGIHKNERLTIFFATHSRARYQLEASTHTLLKNKRLQKEWFKCSPIYAAVAMDRARRNWFMAITACPRQASFFVSQAHMDAAINIHLSERRLADTLERADEERETIRKWRIFLDATKPRIRVPARVAA